jgi:hypothetical protein
MSHETQLRVLRSLESIETVHADWVRLSSLPEHNWELYWSSIRSRLPPPEPYVVALLEDGHLRTALVGRTEAGHVSLDLGYWTVLRVPVRKIVVPMQGLLAQSGEGALVQMVDRVIADLRERRADVIVFEYLEQGSALYRAVRSVPLAFWMRERVPERRVHRQLRLPPTFKEYDREHKGLLQKVRRFERAFQGRFEHRLLTHEDQIEAFCEGAEEVARRTYQRALGEGFLNRREDLAMIRAAAGQGAWRGFATLVDGKTVAFWCGCQFGSSVYLWWTGYDSAFQAFSPGLVSSARMVELLIAAGVTAVDFGGGDAAYKERLCNASWWEESVCFFAPGIKGFLASGVRSVDSAVGNLTRVRLKGLANRVKTPWRRLMMRGLAGRGTPPRAPDVREDAERPPGLDREPGSGTPQ